MLPISDLGYRLKNAASFLNWQLTKIWSILACHLNLTQSPISV